MESKNEKLPTPALNPADLLRLQMAKLKLRYVHLTERDVYFDYGQKEVMMNGLQAKLGKTREELNSLLMEMLRR
jgi:hypothetical protein